MKVKPNHPWRKPTSKAGEIRKAYKADPSLTPNQLAAMFGVTASYARLAIKGGVRTREHGALLGFLSERGEI